MNLVSWLAGGGFAIIGIGSGAYFSNYRGSGLWIAFAGLILTQFAFAYQWQQRIWQESVTVPGFVFVKNLSMAFSNYSEIEINGKRMRTLVGQPRFVVHIQSVDRAATNIRLLPAFLIAPDLPPQRPTIAPRKPPLL